MMKRDKALFFLALFLLLICVPANLVLAKSKEKKNKDAVQLIEATNFRLNSQVEGLLKNIEALSKDKADLQNELDRINADRDEIIGKLKIITEENTKLKEQMPYLQTGIVKLEDLRKALDDDNKAMANKIEKLEKQLQPLTKARDEDKTYKDKYERAEKELKAMQQKEVRIEKVKEQVSAYRNKCERLEKELADARKANAEIKDKFEDQKKDSGNEIKRLQDTVNKLKQNNDKLLAEKKELRKSLNDSIAEVSNVNMYLERLKWETADMHYNLGVILQKDNKWDEAIREYKRVVKIRPDDADAHFNLALIYDTVKNDRDKAIYYYKKYLDIKPDAEDAAKVKEYIVDISTEKKVWGESDVVNINEKRGRW